MDKILPVKVIKNILKKIAHINVSFVLVYKIIVQLVSNKELILLFVIANLDNLMMVTIPFVKVK